MRFIFFLKKQNQKHLKIGQHFSLSQHEQPGAHALDKELICEKPWRQKKEVPGNQAQLMICLSILFLHLFSKELTSVLTQSQMALTLGS